MLLLLDYEADPNARGNPSFDFTISIIWSGTRYVNQVDELHF